MRALTDACSVTKVTDDNMASVYGPTPPITAEARNAGSRGAARSAASVAPSPSLTGCAATNAPTRLPFGGGARVSARIRTGLTYMQWHAPMEMIHRCGLFLRGRISMLRFVGFAALAAMMSSAHAEEPLRLAPSSNWHVNYADDSCRLARAFGTGDEEVTLVLDRFRPGPTVRMTLTGEPVQVRSGIRRISLRFGPNDPEFEKGFTPGVLDNGKAALVVGGNLWITGYDPVTAANEDDGKIPPVDPALYTAIRFLELRIAGKQTVVLETGSMTAAEQALSTCTDDLLRGWGIDAEADKSLSRRVTPLGSPGAWIRNGDYPMRMRHLGYQGLVHFRLIVDDRGMPKSCHIQLSTRPKDFDDTVCSKVMARARFEPALDAEGKPIVSYYTNSARFSTPTSYAR